MVKLVGVQDKISVLQPACFHLGNKDLLLLLWSKFLVFKYTNTNQTNQSTTFKICLFKNTLQITEESFLRNKHLT